MLKWLFKKLLPNNPGIQLTQGPFWKISGANVQDPETVFSAMDLLVPRDAILYLESPCNPDVALRYAKMEIPVEQRTQVALGTLWPKSNFFHLRTTSSTFKMISELSRCHAQPEICIHYIIYKGNTVLISGYDAFSSPIYCSSNISEDNVKRFCKATKVDYASIPNFA